ncbi:prepilin-type N-terminal cleavage/methylation domain-containing protein, partial [uncultured Psychrosphaera sp.]
MKNTNQQGFTLVELIIVIVILGVLAVTAAPKFLDVKSDAIGGTLDG